MQALGEAIVHLPWLSPCAGSLLRLARAGGPSAWTEIRTDPGAVLHVVRQATPTLATPTLSFFPALLRDPVLLQNSLRFIDQPDVGWVDWQKPELRPIFETCTRYAHVAMRLAETTGRCDPDNAWVAGLLAPLGWLAACAIDGEKSSACLVDPALSEEPGWTQRRHWGFDQSSIARRLARRWQLPAWLAAVVGHLGLPVETAQTLGADPDLFRLAQLAVGCVQEHQGCLHLPVGAAVSELAVSFGLTAAKLQSVHEFALDKGKKTAAQPWQPPSAQPLLRDLLALAVENRRLRGSSVMERLERDVDDLHDALETQRTGEATRLRDLKLIALAELAAGAGHEINNPLAVISGQAQYLLNHESEGPRQKALQTIISQTQRIHGILTDLMQFARPARPQKQVVDISAQVHEVIAGLADFAGQHRVQLNSPVLDPILVYVDPRQTRTTLSCLLRNAIESAARVPDAECQTADDTVPPAQSPLPVRWASIRVETPATDVVELIVEDSGKGPPPAIRESMFDPFFSGRSAGRGRGLGLPTAWRLAREQGGDVRFVDVASQPTRFVLSLPRDLPPVNEPAPRLELRA
jgi:signal transduction histidine kinase